MATTETTVLPNGNKQDFKNQSKKRTLMRIRIYCSFDIKSVNANSKKRRRKEHRTKTGPKFEDKKNAADHPRGQRRKHKLRRYLESNFKPRPSTSEEKAHKHEIALCAESELEHRRIRQQAQEQLPDEAQKQGIIQGPAPSRRELDSRKGVPLQAELDTGEQEASGAAERSRAKRLASNLEVQEAQAERESPTQRSNLVPLIRKDLLDLGHSSKAERTNAKLMTGASTI